MMQRRNLRRNEKKQQGIVTYDLLFYRATGKKSLVLSDYLDVTARHSVVLRL